MKVRRLTLLWGEMSINDPVAAGCTDMSSMATDNDTERAFWTDLVHADRRKDDDVASEVSHHRTVHASRPQVGTSEHYLNSSTAVSGPVLRSILSSSASMKSAASSGKRTPRSVTFSDLPEVYSEEDEDSYNSSLHAPSYDDTHDTHDNSDEDDEVPAPTQSQDENVRAPKRQRQRRMSYLQRFVFWIRRVRLQSQLSPVDRSEAAAAASRSEKKFPSSTLDSSSSTCRLVISGPLPLSSSLSRRTSSSMSRRSASTAQDFSTSIQRPERHAHMGRPRKLWHVWPGLSCGIS